MNYKDEIGQRNKYLLEKITYEKEGNVRAMFSHIDGRKDLNDDGHMIYTAFDELFSTISGKPRDALVRILTVLFIQTNILNSQNQEIKEIVKDILFSIYNDMDKYEEKNGPIINIVPKI